MSFKQHLKNLVDNIKYDDFFSSVENCQCPYDKNRFNELRKEFIAQTRDYNYPDRLKIFVDTLNCEGVVEMTANHTPPPPYSKADIDALSFSHAFRPETAKNLLQKMAVQGQCFNLYGKKGIGKKRMLEDLQKCGLRDAQFVLMDMKYHVENHARFLEKLARECSVSAQNLGQIVDSVKQKAHLFLLLDNFEEIFKDNPKKDKRYNGDFFDELNGLKTARQSLIIVSQEKHTSHILDGRRSWLTVNEYELSEHTYAQVEAEIKRRLPAIEEQALSFLIGQFEFHKYDLMNHVVNDIVDSEEDINSKSFEKLKEISGKLIRKYS